MSKIFYEYCDKLKTEDYLYMRMCELITQRNEAVISPQLISYEEQYVIGGMKNATDIMEYPSADYVYLINLERIEYICRVMIYKTILFYRYENSFGKNFEKEKESILLSIKYNPFVSYADIVNADTSLEIETVLEHLIETQQLKSIRMKKKNKYGNRKWILNT